MNTVLFVSDFSRRCGVYQHGLNTYKVLSQSQRFQFVYVECCSSSYGPIELFHALALHNPAAVIYNWHPTTMPWLNDVLYQCILTSFPAIRHAAIVHEEMPPFPWMDAFIHLDPSREEAMPHFPVARPIPKYTPKPIGAQNVIGTFGFAAQHKNYTRIVQQVNKEFSSATIRFHVPSADYGDHKGELARYIMDECRRLAKSGIKIEVNHTFLDHEALLDWLSENSVNCFFFDRPYGLGISSSIDYALAVRRPIAITDSCMFRHISKTQPSILIEKSSLKEIIANGTKPLERFYSEWTEENLLRDYERITDRVIKSSTRDLATDSAFKTGQREALQPVTDQEVKPLSGRKESNSPGEMAQYEFLLQQARALINEGDQILVIGGHNDPIGPALSELGYQVTIEDPKEDGKGINNVWMEFLLLGTTYNLIICGAVLEQVENEVSFLKQIHDVLKPGATAIITASYQADGESLKGHPPGRRVYTPKRLQALCKHFPSDSLIAMADTGKAYSEHAGTNYAFCAFALKGAKEEKAISTSLKSYIRHLFRTHCDEVRRLQDVETEYKQIHPSLVKIARKFQVVVKKIPVVHRIARKIVQKIQ